MKRYLKKSLSILMAFLMVFSCFVLAPEMFIKADAVDAGSATVSTAGKYYWYFYAKTSDGGDGAHFYWNVTGKNNNGTGSEKYQIVSQVNKVLKSNNTTYNIFGSSSSPCVTDYFPTKIVGDYDNDAIVTRSAQAQLYLYVGSSASNMVNVPISCSAWYGSDGKGSASASGNTISFDSKKRQCVFTVTTNESAYPYVDKFSLTSTSNPLNVPKPGASTATATTTVTPLDQYGAVVKGTVKYKFVDSNGIEMSMPGTDAIKFSVSNGTSSNSCTISVYNKAREWLADDGVYIKDLCVIPTMDNINSKSGNTFSNTDMMWHTTVTNYKITASYNLPASSQVHQKTTNPSSSTDNAVNDNYTYTFGGSTVTTQYNAVTKTENVYWGLPLNPPVVQDRYAKGVDVVTNSKTKYRDGTDWIDTEVAFKFSGFTKSGTSTAINKKTDSRLDTALSITYTSSWIRQGTYTDIGFYTLDGQRINASANGTTKIHVGRPQFTQQSDGSLLMDVIQDPDNENATIPDPSYEGDDAPNITTMYDDAITAPSNPAYPGTSASAGKYEFVDWVCIEAPTEAEIGMYFSQFKTQHPRYNFQLLAKTYKFRAEYRMVVDSSNPIKTYTYQFVNGIGSQLSSGSGLVYWSPVTISSATPAAQNSGSYQNFDFDNYEYSFIGWTTNPDRGSWGTEVEYTAGQTYRLKKDTTFYPCYKETIRQLNVTTNYYSKGVSGDPYKVKEGPIKNYMTEKGKTYDLGKCPSFNTEDWTYDFIGWSDTEYALGSGTANSTKYPLKGSKCEITLTDDVNVYAVYSKKPVEYKTTYYNGSTELLTVDNLTNKQTYQIAAQYTGETPTKARNGQKGYYFKGWSLSPSSSITVSQYTINGDVVKLYAVFGEYDYYTVTFKDENGKTILSSNNYYSYTNTYEAQSYSDNLISYTDDAKQVGASYIPVLTDRNTSVAKAISFMGWKKASETREYYKSGNAYYIVDVENKIYEEVDVTALPDYKVGGKQYLDFVASSDKNDRVTIDEQVFIKCTTVVKKGINITVTGNETYSAVYETKTRQYPVHFYDIGADITKDAPVLTITLDYGANVYNALQRYYKTRTGASATLVDGKATLSQVGGIGMNEIEKDQSSDLSIVSKLAVIPDGCVPTVVIDYSNPVQKSIDKDGVVTTYTQYKCVHGDSTESLIYKNGSNYFTIEGEVATKYIPQEDDVISLIGTDLVKTFNGVKYTQYEYTHVVTDEETGEKTSTDYTVYKSSADGKFYTLGYFSIPADTHWYEYSFNGWTPNISSAEVVNGEMRYVATYKTTAVTHNVHWLVPNTGDDNLSTNVNNYAEYKSEQTYTIEGTTYVRYTYLDSKGASVNVYSSDNGLTFKNIVGTSVTNATIPSGKIPQKAYYNYSPVEYTYLRTIAAPGKNPKTSIPSVVEDDKTWVFKGWKQVTVSGSAVTIGESYQAGTKIGETDLYYIAEFEWVENSHTIHIYNENNVEIEKIDGAKGTIFTLPTASKAPVAEGHYVFMGYVTAKGSSVVAISKDNLENNAIGTADASYYPVFTLEGHDASGEACATVVTKEPTYKDVGKQRKTYACGYQCQEEDIAKLVDSGSPLAKIAISTYNWEDYREGNAILNSYIQSDAFVAFVTVDQGISVGDNEYAYREGTGLKRLSYQWFKQDGTALGEVTELPAAGQTYEQYTVMNKTANIKLPTSFINQTVKGVYVVMTVEDWSGHTTVVNSDKLYIDTTLPVIKTDDENTDCFSFTFSVSDDNEIGSVRLTGQDGTLKDLPLKAVDVSGKTLTAKGTVDINDVLYSVYEYDTDDGKAAVFSNDGTAYYGYTFTVGTMGVLSVEHGGYIATVKDKAGNSAKSNFTVSKEHTWNAGTVTKEATCTEQGSKDYKCINCTAEKTEILTALGHDYGDEEVVKEATCTEKGEMGCYCTRRNCDEYVTTQVIDELNHGYNSETGKYTFLKKVAAVPHTCIENGTIEYYACEECEKKFQLSGVLLTELTAEDLIDVAPGEHDYAETKRTDATCTKEGVITETCTQCKATRTKSIAKAEHEYEIVEGTQGSCYESIYNEETGEWEETGRVYQQVKCKNCTASYWQNKDLKEHEYVEIESYKKVATCTSNEIIRKVCVNCGPTHTELIDGEIVEGCLTVGHEVQEEKKGTQLSHQAGEAQEIIVKEAKCGVAGEKATVIKCINKVYDDDEETLIDCPYEFSRVTEVIPALSHNYVEVSNVPVSCGAEGVKTEKCTLCGDVKVTKTPADPSLHNYVLISETSATCIDDGIKTEKCSLCNDVKQTVIANADPSLHNYQIVGEETTATCKVAGVKKVRCEYCLDEIETVTPADPSLHKYEFVSETFATCKDDGVKTEKCSVCEDIKQTTTPASETLHNYEYYDQTSATCTENGVLTEKCSICEKTRDTVTETPTGHNWDLENATVKTEATCLAAGEKLVKCKNDESHTKTISYTADGHKLGETVTYKEPTCGQNGYGEKGKQCEWCKKYFDVEIIDNSSIAHTKGENPVLLRTDIMPTCTKEGSGLYKCSVCSEPFTSAVATKAHKYKLIAATEATCAASGNKAYYLCTTCFGYFKVKEDGKPGDLMTAEEKADVFVDINSDPSAHTPVLVPAVAATCIQSGNIAYYECSVCHRSFKAEDCTEEITNVKDLIIEATGNHTYEKDATTGEDIWTVTKEGNCGVSGIKVKNCTVCNHEETETIEPTGEHPKDDTQRHILRTEKKATCTEIGTKVYFCHVCECSYEDDIDPKTDVFSHNYSVWDEGVTTEPTCEEDGYILYTRECKDCEDTVDNHFNYKKETIDKLGHDWDYANELGLNTVDETIVDGIKTVTVTYHCKRENCTAISENVKTTTAFTVHVIGKTEGDIQLGDREVLTADKVAEYAPTDFEAYDSETDSENEVKWFVNDDEIAFPYVVTSNVTVEAKVINTKKTYTVTFMNSKNQIISKKQYFKGEEVDVPESPYLNGYKFQNWEGTVQGSSGTIIGVETVSANTVYKPLVKNLSDIKTVYITYKNDSGTQTLYTDKVEWDTTDEVSQTYNVSDYTTTKSANSVFHYNFIGWTLDGELFTSATFTKDSQNITLKAKFENEKHTETPAPNPTVVEPTCTTNEKVTYTCDVCGKQWTISGSENGLRDATQHNFQVDDSRTRVEGNITYYTLVCQNPGCGQESTRTVVAGEVVEYIGVRVTDGTDAIEGATVQVLVGAVKTLSAKTDAEGVAKFPKKENDANGLADGTYLVNVTKDGYGNGSGNLVVSGGVGIVTLTLTKEQCHCACHRTGFFGSLKMFFSKIMRIFNKNYKCCDCGHCEEKY